MKRRKTLAILLASISLLSLTACLGEDKPSGNAPSESEKVTEEITHDIAEDSYKAQLEYYMEVVESLQDELLSSKESVYVMEAEYKLKIEELEDSVRSLSDRLKDAENGKSENRNESTVTPPPKEPSGLDNLSQSSSGDGSKEDTDTSPTQKNYFEYKIADGTVTIVSFSGEGDQVSVPEKIGGYPVRTIGEGAFRNAKVNSVVLPEGILKIDWFAFEGCTTLKKIELPSSVASIGYGAFDRCPDDIIIICKKGSYAEAYAASWGMLYLAE